MAFALLPLFVVTFIQFGHSRMPVPNEFELNPPKIELLLRRTALMALLRAKANAMLETVPLVDKVLFRQCVIESNALSPVKLAKCLAKLIQLRDQLQRQNEWEEKLVESSSDAAPEGKEGRNDFFQSSLITKRKLARIRHFFALWRRWKGRRLAELKMKNRRITLGLGGATDKRKPDEVEAVRHKAVRRDTVRRNTATLLLNDDNLRNLQELERYTRVFDKARRSIAQINAHNTELISRFDPSARVRSAMPDGPPALLDLQHQIERFFNSLGIDKISLLSPRFFSLFPSSQRRRPNLLSPDLFSFHNNSASPLSIPSLLSSVHLSERESAAWLELLMNITGNWPNCANFRMEHLVDKMKPDVQRLERDVLPVIEQMEQAEERWQRLRGLLSEGQRRMMELRGYTPLMEVQRSVLFPDASPSGCSESNEITEHVLEQNIIELAKMEEGGPAEHNLDLFRPDGGQKRAFRQERRRKKRQADTGGLAPDTEEGRSIPRTVALEPFAFDTRLGGVVLEGIYLSPTAFYRELASPEVLTIRALSPIAFYATILSPMVAFARILSPEVFKAQILTPQVLDAFVLSPEAFMAEVLSPLAAEGRVLSPRTLFVQILGPTIGALHIGSPDTHGVLVLSPHILSPRIYSEERYLIEILSLTSSEASTSTTWRRTHMNTSGDRCDLLDGPNTRHWGNRIQTNMADKKNVHKSRSKGSAAENRQTEDTCIWSITHKTRRCKRRDQQKVIRNNYIPLSLLLFGK